MKILWMSDSPTEPTGFGNVTRAICTGLAGYGHHVSILGWPGHGQPRPWQNCMLYPIRQNQRGADVFLNYLRTLQPDVLITLDDIYYVKYMLRPEIRDAIRRAGIPWVYYYPVESAMGDGRLPPEMVRVLRAADVPVAMSRYGQQVGLANGVSSAYIPHGVDTSLFQPAREKRAAKQALGYQERFVILSDARNQPRKLLPRTLEIFRRFAAGKDDVLLHLHCDPQDPMARLPIYRYDLRSDIDFLGLADTTRVTRDMSMHTGLSVEHLAELYQAADVHLLTSWGEGFGLPTLQAAATGVVPMAVAYSASRELVLHHGEAVAVRAFLFDMLGRYYALMDIDDAVARLERLYRDQAFLVAKASCARAFALKYDWRYVVCAWHELLQREIPRLRASRQVDAPRIMLYHPGSQEHEPCFARGVDEPEELTAAPVEVRAFDDFPCLPVTLPLARPRQARRRITGSIYAASVWDLPCVLSLGRIFPGLQVWSTVSLGLPAGSPGSRSGAPEQRVVQTQVVQVESAEYRAHLASTTLALDIAGFDATLPVQAAAMQVPCIALACSPEQCRLWPTLCLTEGNQAEAARLGRQVLTDYAMAIEVCVYACQRLAETPSLVASGEQIASVRAEERA
jgi:glycosyltransferase involved in cell wall biosynthesis